MSSSSTSISGGKRTGSGGGGGGITPLQPNPHWARLPLFARKGWKCVRFGDVVENLNETCAPEAAGLELFIGLEHLEPGSLHIRAWGDVADDRKVLNRHPQVRRGRRQTQRALRYHSDGGRGLSHPAEIQAAHRPELFDKAYAYIRQYYRSGTIAPVRDGTLSTRCGVSIPGEPEMIEPRCSAEHVAEDRQGEKRDATPQQ